MPILKNSKRQSHITFFNGDNKVILAVGRLTEAKNFGFLIRSFKALHDQHPETRLLILGEGELRARV